MSGMRLSAGGTRLAARGTRFTADGTRLAADSTGLGASHSQLVGLLLDHRLVDVFIRLRFPHPAAQQQAHDDAGDDRGNRTNHDPEQQIPAERHAEQTGDGDRRQAGDDEHVASEDTGAQSRGHDRQPVALNVRRG